MKNAVPKSNLEYVALYATKLREDNIYFKQQKELIDSQIKSSISLFRKRFGVGDVFKLNARKYIKEINLV